ncbi:ribonuclease H-like domain-containing protein [Tanacetum coccineum]|uniref:Ribonuclease H-like domain-containing protein n=1 Tax=Tanacetum coccineum TaxID=301880 RepID=A0ABQ5C189_9ASTR
MDLGQNNSLAKLPLLKQGEYDTWRLRIESYIQLQDYSLWEIIEEGNSFKPVAQTTREADGTSTTKIPGAITIEEKILKKNGLKARSILMMTLPSEIITPEELNLKFLRSLPTEWGMHVVVWRNKSDLGSISFDDLYNNFKIVEPEVKRSITSSSNSVSQNLAFVSGHSSTNDDNIANVHVSTGSSPVSTASTNNSTACLSDATVYAYLATQPNGSQVVHEDLEQIHEDDLDEMDLKWQLALLSMKARKFYQRTGKKIVINGRDTAGYDKKKVECFNCHKLGHFARECRNPKSQENRSRSQDSSRRTVNVKEASPKALLSNRWLQGFEGVTWHKRRLLPTLHLWLSLILRDASYKDSDINGLEKQVERLKKEKEENQFKIDNYENASKSLDQMIGNQLVGNNKKGLGYNIVPPPLTGLFAPPSVDLSSSGIEKFKEPEFEGYGVKVTKSASENVSKEVKKTSDAPIIEDWVSDCDEDETVVLESLNVQKPKQADQPRKVSQNPRNNSTSWNTPKPKKLGVGFQFTPKACFVCGSFNHLIKDCDFHDKKMVQKPVLNNVKKVTGQREVRPVWTNAMRVNHQNFSNSKRNFAPKAVLTKSGLIPVSAARPINTAVHKPFANVAKPRTNVFQKAHSSLRRPFYQQTVLKNRNLSNQVNTANVISVNTVGKQGINAVKPTAYWAWRPKVKMINHVYKNTGFCVCKQFDYVDPTEAKDSEVCKITRADGTSSFHGDFQALLRKLNRQDLFQLYKDDIWLNQHYWELLRWKLHEYSGVHSLFLNGTSIQINMLVDKKYPMKKEILKKMINLKIEAEEESDMASELIKFIKSQITKQVNHKFRGGLLGIKELLQDMLLKNLVPLVEELSIVSYS